MIQIDTELVIAGLLSLSDKPVTSERMWDVRTAFYKTREEYIVDISRDSTIWCTQRYSWFESTPEGIILTDKKDKEKILNRFLGNCPYKDEIKGIFKDFIEKENK